MDNGTTEPTAGAWRALDAALDGEVILPGTAGFAEAGRLFNRRFDTLRPAAIAYPASVADVAGCLAFTRRHHVPIAIRGGGHSYAGWSSGTGRLMVDLRRMDGITVEDDDVLVGAGARLGDVYTALGRHGRTISSGTCLSVGVSGLTLGGGHGLLSRAYGLTCDNLLQATIVTADGTVLTCSTAQEPELFWALRGAGNGNFGVVTDLRLRTHAVHESSSADLAWPWSQAARVIAAWQDWAHLLPDEMWTSLRLQKDARGPSVSVVAFSLGSQDDLAAQLALLPDDRTSYEIRTEPHLGTIRRFAGETDGHPPAPCYDVRSDFFAHSLPDDAIRAAVATVEAAPAHVDAGMALVALGGALNRTPVEETAFVHRGHHLLTQYEASWDPDRDRPASGEADAWLGAIHSAMRPYASGEAYQNDPDPRLPDWRRAYYGSAAARLEQLKRQYDPGRLFDFPHAL